VSWPDIFSLVAGFVVLIVTTVDLVSSTFGHDGGPITRRGLWCFSRLLRRARNLDVKRVHSTAGILIHIAILLWWTLGISLGWFLVFYAGRHDARDVEDHQVEAVDSWMFAVSTVSGLGPGRVRHRSRGWILLRTTAGLTSTLFLGFVVSFAIPLVQAAARKRAIATRLSLIPDPVLAERLEANESLREDVLRDLIEQLHSHLTYPTLSMQFAVHRRHDLAWQLGRLWSALPDEGEIEQIKRVVRAVMDTMTYEEERDGDESCRVLLTMAGWTDEPRLATDPVPTSS